VELPKPADEDIEQMIQHEVRRYRALDTGVTFDT